MLGPESIPITYNYHHSTAQESEAQRGQDGKLLCGGLGLFSPGTLLCATSPVREEWGQMSKA